MGAFLWYSGRGATVHQRVLIINGSVSPSPQHIPGHSECVAEQNCVVRKAG